MSKFKTVDGGQAYRSFPGKLRVLEQENPFQYRVEVWLLNGEVNQNGWQYKNLSEHRSLFVDTPILVAYPNPDKVGDGHNYKVKRDKRGNEYASFMDAKAERIVGWFKSDEDIKLVDKDNVQWIVGEGTIWSYYAQELTALLTEQGARGMDVSIETLVEDIRKENDVEVFDRYQILGTTILGLGVTPAVAGAHIRTLSLADDLKDFKLKVAAYQEEAAKNQEKGNKSKMAFNKAQLDAMREKFHGYVIVGNSEDGMSFGLLSKKDNCLYEYTRQADDGDNIIESRIKPVALNSEAVMENGESIHVDVLAGYDALVKELTDKASAAETAQKQAEERANSAEKEATELKRKEIARRRNSVIAAINALVAKYNEDAENPISDEEVEDVKKDAEEDKYSECENEKGEFCGDEKACQVVKSKIFDHESKIRSDRKKAENSVHSWLDSIRGNSTDNNEGDGVDGLIARNCK